MGELVDKSLLFKAGRADEVGTKTRLMLIAARKLYNLRTPPEQRYIEALQLYSAQDLAPGSLWRIMLGIDDPMGTPKEIQTARLEYERLRAEAGY